MQGPRFFVFNVFNVMGLMTTLLAVLILVLGLGISLIIMSTHIPVMESDTTLTFIVWGIMMILLTKSVVEHNADIYNGLVGHITLSNFLDC